MYDCTNITVQSQDPQIVYSWLDAFELSLSSEGVGKSYFYPKSKSQRSKAMNTCEGYRNTITKYKNYLTGPKKDQGLQNAAKLTQN